MHLKQILLYILLGPHEYFSHEQFLNDDDYVNLFLLKRVLISVQPALIRNS